MKKVIPLALMMALVIYVYSLCRDLKDTLIISKAICGGAETLGFIKIFAVAPTAIFSAFIFIKLSNIFSKEKVFYIIIGSFLIFFLSFGFIIYPLKELLQMNVASVTNLQKLLPSLHWFWPIVGSWCFTLFYVISEMWGAIVLSVLFWQLANEFSTLEESKRHYSFLGFIGNFGLVLSGSAIIFFANLAKKAQISDPLCDPFLRNIRYQMLSVALCCVLLMLTYAYFTKKNTSPFDNKFKHKSEKVRLNFWESIKCVCMSKYLLMITVMIVSYSISMSLLEFIWKGQVKLYYPDTNDFHSLMGKLSLLTGGITLVAMIIGSYILRIFSWRTAALITPFFLLFFSSLFFWAIIYENNYGMSANICGVNILFFAVVLGLIREAVTKGVKYSLFDATKQMAYIPLSPETKNKGQAVIEIVGGRIGKIGGSGLQSALLMCIGGGTTLSSMIDVLGTIVLLVTICWIAAIFSVSADQINSLDEKQ
jgi:AAA family ATP:ADP antiporter